MIKKYPIDKELNTLNFIKTLTEKFRTLYLVEDFEVDPFTKWSIGFSAEYWYLKYHLLKDGEINLELMGDDFINLYIEQNLNINWLTITDKENFKFKCVEGDCWIEILNSSFNRLDELLDL